MEEVLTEKTSVVNLYVTNSMYPTLGLKVKDSLDWMAAGDGSIGKAVVEIVVAVVEIVVDAAEIVVQLLCHTMLSLDS